MIQKLCAQNHRGKAGLVREALAYWGFRSPIPGRQRGKFSSLYKNPEETYTEYLCTKFESNL